MNRPQTVCVDAEFLNSLPLRGNEFMIRAITDRPQAFQAAIDDGWAELQLGHWFHRDFLRSLTRVQDPALAANALSQYWARRTPEEINALMFEKIGTDSCPARCWFSHHNASAHWRKTVLGRAIDLGLDLSTTLSHSAPGVESDRYTLLGTYILDAKFKIYNSRNDSDRCNRDEAMGIISELIDWGSKLDKNTLSVLLKHHRDEGLTDILAMFEQRNQLNATDCLKMVSRMKIESSKLAYLQSKAAMETIDGALSSAMPKAVLR
jgi:hypothetical protein